MTQPRKRLVDYSDDSDEELPDDPDRSISKDLKSIATQTVDPKVIIRSQYLRNIAALSKESTSSTSSEFSSSSQEDDNRKPNGHCSASQSYRTGFYDVEEQVEMINFLINNHRISSCCSIHTWQLMARNKLKRHPQRNPQSLFKQFKEVIAPNIAQFLKTMGRIGEPRLLERFRRALQQAHILENSSSALLSSSAVSPVRTLSSSSADSSKVEAASTKLQKSIASKEPKTPMSSGSCKSLDGTVISDSEVETDTKDTRLIKVPPLFNGSAGQRPVVKESSQTEIKKSAPVTSDIRITKELGKSADAVSTPSIVPKTEPEEDEDDVVLIEAMAWSDETKLVEVKLLIDTPNESVVQEQRNSPSVPANVGENHPIRLKEEKREENHSAAPRAEIPSRIERDMNNKSQDLTSGTTPPHLCSSYRRNNVEETVHPHSKITPIIADSSTNAFDNEQGMIEEDPPAAPVHLEPRFSQIDKKLLQKCRILAERIICNKSTAPKWKGQSRDSAPDGTPSLLRFGFTRSLEKSSNTPNTVEVEESPVESSRQLPKIRVTKNQSKAISRLDEVPMPSTSGGILGHGFQASEYNHLSRLDDSESDGDSGFDQTKTPPNVPLLVNENVPLSQGFQLPHCFVKVTPIERVQEWILQQREAQSAVLDEQFDSTDPDDEETQFPPVRETKSKAPKRKNLGINVKNGGKGSNTAAESAVHSKPPVKKKKKRTKADDPDYKFPNTFRTTKKRRQDADSDDDIDTNSESFNGFRKLKRAKPADLDKVVGPTDSDDEETQFLPVQGTRSKFFDKRRNLERIVENPGRGARVVDANSESSISIRREKTKRKKDDENESDYKYSSDDDDDSAASSESPYRSIRMWERMYGPIEVERRIRDKRINFDENFSMKRGKIPRNCDFSRELLNAIYHDVKHSVRINGQTILGDLALLHYFICRPGDIQNFKSFKVFQKIHNLKWKIFRGRTSSGLYERFRYYIRGYIHQFGLPKVILDEFLYQEWQAKLEREKK